MSTEVMTWQKALTIIEKLSWPDQLQLMTALLQQMQHHAIDYERIDLLELGGVGAEIWSEIDTTDYLNQERESWQT